MRRLLSVWTLAGILCIALAVLVYTFVRDSGGDDQDSPTATPSASAPPLTATGTIGYVTPEGDFALTEPDGENNRVLTQDGGVKSIAWAPDGSVAALERGEGSAAHVRGVRPDGSVAFDIPGAGPIWSPAGDRIVVVQAGDVVVSDASGGAVRTFENGAMPAWSPDGTRIAFVKLGADGDGVPVIGDIATGDETPLDADIAPSAPEFPIAWHPSGGVIGYQNRLYEPSTGTTTDLSGMAVLWSPDGRLLMIAEPFSPPDDASPGWLLDATQGFAKIIGFYIRPSAQDIPAQLFIQKWTAWTPDGDFLFYMDPAVGSTSVRIYHTVGEPTQDRLPDIGGERPDISPDGKTVTFMYQGKVWVMPLIKTDPQGTPMVDASALGVAANGGFPAWQPTLSTSD